MKKELYFADVDIEYRLHFQQVIEKYWPDYTVRSFDNIEKLFRKLVRVCGTGFPGQTPILVICNHQISGLSGYHLLNLLRQKIDGKVTGLYELPVIILMRTCSPDESERCYQAGASLVIEKPVRFNDLKLQLGEILGRFAR